jgi:broad specificity phosphatase PhoE
LLIRHAESRGNYEGRLQGRVEYPLTTRGVRQAQALAQRLAAVSLTAVYSSPIRRAHDTALEAGRLAGAGVTTDDRLQEYDFGRMLSGLTWQEIRDKQPELAAALAGASPVFPAYPGEEGRPAFRERVCAVMSDIIERHRSAEAVAVVTHAGPIAVYLMHVLGREYKRPIPFIIDNASLTTIEINPSPTAYAARAVVTAINDTCHLKGIA